MCLYKTKISGERLQDHWSSCIIYYPNENGDHVYFFILEFTPFDELIVFLRKKKIIKVFCARGVNLGQAIRDDGCLSN